MDDIQFWLYILFAVIYFIARGLKKKKPQKPVNKPESTTTSQTDSRPQRKPVSFEELLKEFTEGRGQEQPEEREVFQEHDEEVDTAYQTVDEQEKDEPFEEGKTRRFSDEESKRVYQESIARAEGASLEFKRDEHFRSKLKSNRNDETGSAVAAEIRDLLSNPNDAKKAVVLSEILNRKY